MEVICTTERLYLRRFDLADATFLYELNADPEVMKYTGDSAFKDVADARLFLTNYLKSAPPNFNRWMVCLKANKLAIGWCGLKLHADGVIDLGYRLKQAYWGQGFATESAQACLDYGFNKLLVQEIIGRTATANINSSNVLEKIGMKFYKFEACKGIDNAKIYKIRHKEYGH